MGILDVLLCIRMPKRIVILSAFLSPYRSGAEAMVEEVSKRLGHDFDITIVTGRYDRSLPKRDLIDQSVHVIRIGMGSKIDKYLYPFLAPFKARGLKPDIVHAVLESYAGFALVLCRWIIPRAKRILTLQSTNTSALLGAMHSSAHVITAISSALIERARKYGRTDVVLIPNGIDLELTQEAVRSHVRVPGRILYVGRLEYMKAVDTLLTAFALLLGDAELPLKSLHLKIVGDGSQREYLQKLARDLSIDDRVTFTGKLSPVAVLDEYAQAEIFCGLSRSEALGNVFLEAQAAGCAVIGTKVGGIPEIVKDGETGLLVTPEKLEEIVEAMKKLVVDAGLRGKLTAAGRENAKEYDWDVMSEKYREVYSK